MDFVFPVAERRVAVDDFTNEFVDWGNEDSYLQNDYKFREEQPEVGANQGSLSYFYELKQDYLIDGYLREAGIEA